MTTRRYTRAKWALVLMLGGVLGLGAAPAAQATTTLDAPYASWLKRAPSLPVVSVLDTSACGAEPALGCSDGYSFVAVLGPDRFTFSHEMGHVFEFSYLRDDSVAQAHLARLFGRPKLVWGVFSGDSGGGNLREWFADAFAWCLLKEYIGPRWELSTGSGLTRGSRLRRICAFVSTFAPQ